jgi:hypothetical protein
MTTDEEAEAFLDQDLSDLDFAALKPFTWVAEQVGWVLAPTIFRPSLPERALDDLPGPILRRQAAPHVPMERRQRPVPDPTDQPVLDRIDPAILHMPPPVLAVADHVLAVAPLPQSVLAP